MGVDQQPGWLRFLITIVRILLVGALLGGLLTLYAFAEARRLPVIRRAAVSLQDWPAATPPITIALLSDIHLGNATMDEQRLASIVDELNAQRPDLILLAGDFIAGHQFDPKGIIAHRLTPVLARLRAPLGVVAVLGNHDHWSSETVVSASLRAAGITVLSNEAVKRGPLVIGGLDDDFTHHTRTAPTLAAMARLRGPRLLLSHSPDPAARIAPPLLLLAGHTHCGQVDLPIIGRLASVSHLGERFACGWVKEPGRTVIVTAGLGTSLAPFRFGAPPDVWLVTVGGAQR